MAEVRFSSSEPEARRRRVLSPRLLIGSGLGVLVVVVVADRAWSSRGLAEEWPPVGTTPYLARSAALAVASLLLVLGARRLLQAAPAPREDTEPLFESAAAVGSLAIALGSVGLLLVDPSLLSSLASEDHLIEWSSAVLCFAAGAMAALAARRYRAATVGDRQDRLRGAVLIVIALGFTLLGLEEVSWFQRVFDVESPEVFVNRNRQGETNLHNLATTATGNGYYMGAFLFCTLAPVLLADRALPRRWRWIEPLLPTRTVFFATAVSAAIVYEMWNVIWIQMTFWMTVVAVPLISDGDRRRLIGGFVLAAMVLTAFGFLFHGDAMVRTWDDTEVRELVIPYGLAWYGAQVWRKAPATTSPSAPGR